MLRSYRINGVPTGAVAAFVLTRLCYAWDDHGAGRRLHPAFGALAIAPYLAVAVFVSV